MNIYVIDKSFQTVAVIDSYISVIWTRRYYTYGDFELYLSAEERLLDILREGYYLVRDRDKKSDGYYNVMVINYREIITNVEEGDNLLVKGYCLKSLLSRRVVVNQTSLRGTVQNCIRQLLNENIIAPTDNARAISNFITGADTFTDSTELKTQITGKNLGEAITDICKRYGYGYDVYLNNGVFTFYMYKGVNRSYSQSENAHVVVSESFDNLLSSDYSQSKQTFGNVAIVAGEGEGANRKKTTVGTATGLERYEMWIDARNASTNNGEISDAEYYAMLASEGQEAIAEHDITTLLNGEIINGVSFQINRDYYLGDIIQFENDYGVSASTRVVEVIESEDENGENIIPTFEKMEV